ncbi:hypothetical protein [Nocardiopsis protaetiae]|uniref:hypothetical protein n=1 Tax=Nocardiopsis protaetiae TaxID=3382270 RepID=UPI00387B0E96
MKLPYLYQPGGPEEGLLVTPGKIAMHKGLREALMDIPVGPDAVALARAILAAAGDTGREVVSADEIDAYRARAARGFELTCEVRKLTEERDELKALAPRWESLRAMANAAARPDLTGVAGAAAAQAAQSMRERAVDAARSAVVVDRELSLTEQRAAIVAAIRGLGPLVPVVHADLPEAVTPCGLGTQDVATGVRVSEVSCLECLRTLASVRVGDQFPAADLVEPGDEVPTLCELDGRMDSLETRLSAVEDRLSPPTTQAAPAEPTHYRDRDGDVWESAPGQVVWMADEPDAKPYVHSEAEAMFGPLYPVTSDARCECGLAADDQETGPGGACRHTPATRLGRPKDNH